MSARSRADTPPLEGVQVDVQRAEVQKAGQHCRPGRDLLLADSAADFADAIVRLLRSPETRERIGRSGRNVAEQLYDWNQLGAQLEIALHDVIAGRETTPIGVVVSAANA